MPEETATSKMPTLRFYTSSSSTPNTFVVSGLLEELREIYGDDHLRYEPVQLNMMREEQKSEWYLKICPNGRVPAIKDTSRNDFVVFETSAILLYLVQHYDPDGHFHLKGQADLESEVIQWLFFAHGGIGPMQGQSNVFLRYAPEKIPYAIDRYRNETMRLYDVLEARLSDRDFLVGPGRGVFSIADMKAVSWVMVSPWAGIYKEDKPALVQAWQDRILARPGFKRGIHVPAYNELYESMVADDFEEKEAEVTEKIKKKMAAARKQFAEEEEAKTKAEEQSNSAAEATNAGPAQK